MNTETQTTAIAEYSPTAAALADIERRMAKVVYDVSTPEGMAAAKKDRAEVRDLRVALEHKRVEIKAPALKRCQEIDAEAQRITAELRKYEDPPDKAIKAEEARLEKIRQAKIKAEEARQAAIQERIREFAGCVVMVSRHNMTAAQIGEHIADLEKIVVDESFGDMKDGAELAKDSALSQLRAMQRAAAAREAEAARLAAERAELARQRAEQERVANIKWRISHIRNRVEAAQVCRTSKEIASHVTTVAAMAIGEAEFAEFLQDAMQAQLETLNRLNALHIAAKDRETVAAEQAAEAERIRKDRAAVEAAQRAQAEREAAERQRLEDEARAKREAELAAERRVAFEKAQQARHDFVPDLDGAVAVLAAHYGQTPARVMEWLPGLIKAKRRAA